MVNGKNVTFREKSMEKSPSPKRFEEPEGMTDIDLRRLSEMSGLSDSSVRKFDPKNVKDAMFKILAVFLCVGFATMVLVLIFRQEPLHKHPRVLNKINSYPKQEYWNERNRQIQFVPTAIQSESEQSNNDDKNNADVDSPTNENSESAEDTNDLKINSDINGEHDKNTLQNSILEFVSINLEKLQKCKFEQTVEACCLNAETNSTPCNVKSIVEEIKKREENFAKTQQSMLQKLLYNPSDFISNDLQLKQNYPKENIYENILKPAEELDNNFYEKLLELPEKILKYNKKNLFESILDPSKNILKQQQNFETEILPKTNEQSNLYPNEIHIKSPHFNFDSYKIKLNNPNQLIQIPKNLENIINLPNLLSNKNPLLDSPRNPFWILNPHKELTERSIPDDLEEDLLDSSSSNEIDVDASNQVIKYLNKEFESLDGIADLFENIDENLVKDHKIDENSFVTFDFKIKQDDLKNEENAKNKMNDIFKGISDDENYKKNIFDVILLKNKGLENIDGLKRGDEKNIANTKNNMFDNIPLENEKFKNNDKANIEEQILSKTTFPKMLESRQQINIVKKLPIKTFSEVLPENQLAVTENVLKEKVNLENLKEIGSKLITKFKEIGKSVGEEFHKIEDKINPTVNNLKTKIVSTFNTFEREVGEEFHKIEDKINPTGNNPKMLGSRQQINIVKKLPTKTFSEVLPENQLAVTENAIKEKVNLEKLKEIGSELITKFKEIGKSVGEEFHKIEDKINPTVNNLKTKIVSTFNTIEKEMEPRFKVIKDFPKQVVKETGSTLKKIQEGVKVIPEKVTNVKPNVPEGFLINLNPFNLLNFRAEEHIGNSAKNAVQIKEEDNNNLKNVENDSNEQRKEKVNDENKSVIDSEQSESDENAENMEAIESTTMNQDESAKSENGLEASNESNEQLHTSRISSADKPKNILGKDFHKKGLMLQIIQKNRNSVSPIIINGSGFRSFDDEDEQEEEKAKKTSIGDFIHSDESSETTEHITTESTTGSLQVTSKIENMEIPSIEKTDVSLDLNETNVNVTYSNPKTKRQAPDFYGHTHHNHHNQEQSLYRNHENHNQFRHHGQYDYRGEEELGLEVDEGLHANQNHRGSQNVYHQTFNGPNHEEHNFGHVLHDTNQQSFLPEAQVNQNHYPNQYYQPNMHAPGMPNNEQFGNVYPVHSSHPDYEPKDYYYQTPQTQFSPNYNADHQYTGSNQNNEPGNFYLPGHNVNPPGNTYEQHIPVQPIGTDKDSIKNEFADYASTPKYYNLGIPMLPEEHIIGQQHNPSAYSKDDFLGQEHNPNKLLETATVPINKNIQDVPPHNQDRLVFPNEEFVGQQHNVATFSTEDFIPRHNQDHPVFPNDEFVGQQHNVPTFPTEDFIPRHNKDHPVFPNEKFAGQQHNVPTFPTEDFVTQQNHFPTFPVQEHNIPAITGTLPVDNFVNKQHNSFINSVETSTELIKEITPQRLDEHNENGASTDGTIQTITESSFNVLGMSNNENEKDYAQKINNNQNNKIKESHLEDTSNGGFETNQETPFRDINRAHFQYTNKNEHNEENHVGSQSQSNPRISTEAKIGQFNTAIENMQSSQHSSMNPNFAKQCIPISPPVGSPLQVVQQQLPFQYDPNVRFTQLIPVSVPKPQANSFVINPQITYVTPNMQQAYNGFGTYFPPSQAAPPQMVQQPTGPSGQYYICNPITASNNQVVAGIPGVEVRNAEEMVSASLNNMTTRQSERCPMGHELCADNSKCIKTERICDGEVNCEDGSDEVYCSCKYRLGQSRWCDGYYDCPNGEDEIGCFGCQEGFFNCDDWSYSHGSTCIPVNLRCNGISDCPSGTDEQECSVLLDTIQTSEDLFKVSNNAGFLHRNYEGKWYPVCSNPEYWALDACKYETGPSIIPPLTRVVPLESPYNGNYASAGEDNEIHLAPNCLEKRAVYVECPQPTCGIRWVYNNPYRREEVDTSAEEIAARFNGKGRTASGEWNNEEGVENKSDSNLDDIDVQLKANTSMEENDMKLKDGKHSKSEEAQDEKLKKREKMVVGNLNKTEDILGNGRVVGGRPCQPGAWPWVVSIYKNGAFHCGGVLITDTWLLTAGHCTEKYWLYFYEIELGMLRRFSFSPMQQTRYVTDVIPHPGYDRKNLKNDLAMMRMNHPVKFNRYVRPICLPNEYTAGQFYQNGPTPGTVCTAVGWGATVEHGVDPDHMREVEVPVLPVCKHKEDEEGNEICAGLMEGGKDACQGDSGGPFLCRNPNMPQQWYLAGIVSHGEGCARPNEPGVYTKVAIYRDWIYEYAKDDRLPQRKPLNHCPGYTCRSINKCIPKKRRCDRVIDCLYGDDEIDCERGNSFSSLFKHAMKNMMFSYDGLSRSNVERPGNPTVPDDTISTTFKMENSPITDTPNGNGFAKDDSSFASPAEISDRTEFISNAEATTATTTVDESPEESISSATVRNKEGAERPAKTDVNRTVMMKPFKGERFLCRKMLEVIPAEKKCDKTIDCQDGTDEESCACADYLKHSHPEAICDGVTDCSDLSDENDCNSSCGRKHFYCRLSKVCIPMEKKCDNRPDCDYNEDEWDCFTLADSNRVLLDADSRPALLRSGLLAFNQRNNWVPLCMNFTGIEGKIAADACVTMGFSDYEKFLQVEVPNKKLRIGKEDEILGEVGKSAPCSALYIKCADVSVSGHEIGKEDRLNVASELHTPPWNAAVYADGEYKCAGTVLNLNWILTSVNCFPGILKLHQHYVAVLTGAHKGYLHVGGPHEQTVRVTEADHVPDSEVVLLRLEKRLRFTRYVHPLHFKITGDFVRLNERCLVIGRDQSQKSRLVYLRPFQNCSEDFRCFERMDETSSSECQVSDSVDPWSGCVFCDSGSGFYPAAVFHEPRGWCGFSGNITLPSITPLKRTMFSIMERSELLVHAPPCEGFRCNLGECIKAQSVCNGIPDCRDSADEEAIMCEDYRRNCHLAGNCSCLPSEMQCKNGKCVEKTTFCDQVNDCGDGSDEPDTCNCQAYLRLANSSKICDGVRNCLDKSDEDPALCKCKPGQFKCGKSEYCVSNDMLCDGESNCPNNEDEEKCVSLQSSDENINIGEVFTRTYGIWHPGCFPEHLTTLQLEDICKKIGFAGNSASYLNTTASQTGRPVLDTFSSFWVHRGTGRSKIRLSLRSGDRNFVNFVDDPQCHRLFLRCL